MRRPPTMPMISTMTARVLRLRSNHVLKISPTKTKTSHLFQPVERTRKREFEYFISVEHQINSFSSNQKNKKLKKGEFLLL